MSTNERDELGEDLVPDYISRVLPGGFYGWPWFYIGNHQDPRHKGAHAEFADKVLVPDVLVQSHSATLNLCFYDGAQFPAEYKGDIFAAFHGSWNRARRTGYKIVRVPFDKATGKARGDYEDFVTGFVTPEGNVWGRPVGITVAKDGSLLFSEDGNKTIWRVSYVRK
jgi:glucose/arabinose dehydrogenase